MNRYERLLGICCAAFGLLSLGRTCALAAPPANQGYVLVFDDEFSGTSVDTTKWTTNGYPWGSLSHQDQSVKVASQLSVANGILTITSQPGTVAGQPAYIYNTPFGTLPLNYLSGCITSYQHWNKGYFEARFKMPWQTSTWPAFWMLQNGWPPELDILEIHGNVSQEQYTYHYTDGSGNAASWGGTYNGPNFSAGWHIFGMEWTSSHINFYVDGTLINSYTDASTISQMNDMYLLIEDQIGGWAPAPVASQYPAQMQVDYVRVYQITGPQSGEYRLTPKNAPGLALSGLGASTANGTPAVVTTANSSVLDQKWYLNEQPNGSYIIQNEANTSQNLDLLDGLTANGSIVDLFENNNSSAQLWNLTYNTDTSWTLSPALAPTSCLEVKSAATTSNSAADISTNTKATNQEWLLQAPNGPLTISNLAVSGITDTSATVTYNTNYATDSTVEYGTALNYGSTATGTLGVTSHSVTLTGLNPATTYYFAPSATDQYGDTVLGQNNTIRTVADSAAGMVITSLNYVTNPTTAIVTATVVLENNTSAPASGVVITNAVLAGGTTLTSVPITIGTMQARGTKTLTLTFPRLNPTGQVGINLYGMVNGSSFTASLNAPVN